MRNFCKKALLLGSCLLVVAGCGPKEGDEKLTVGTVDILRVMEERDETRAIRLEWASQAGDTAMRITAVKDAAEAEALNEEIKRRSKEWQKRVDGFMEDSIKLIESEAAVIAKERGIDIVLVDNTMNPSIKYRDGEDISFDVSMKLQNREE